VSTAEQYQCHFICVGDNWRWDLRECSLFIWWGVDQTKMFWGSSYFRYNPLYCIVNTVTCPVHRGQPPRGCCCCTHPIIGLLPLPLQSPKHWRLQMAAAPHCPTVVKQWGQGVVPGALAPCFWLAPLLPCTMAPAFYMMTWCLPACSPVAGETIDVLLLTGSPPCPPWGKTIARSSRCTIFHMLLFNVKLF
jgi:hypothetical protein